MNRKPTKPAKSNTREADHHAVAPSPAHNPFPVVGIGASAGGLQALTELFKHLPADTGMSFVVIQHLDPDHPSHLTDLLARTTKMPVHEVRNGMAIRPNQIFVIPSNTNLSLTQGKLRLTPRGKARVPHPVDFFFRSLAQEQQDMAIGIVLSGTGSDGTTGLEEIKGAEGIVFAQDEKSAKFSGMPMAAAGNAVDFILPPARIAQELVRIAGELTTHRRVPALEVELPEKKRGVKISSPAPTPPENTRDFRRILAILHAHTGLDFTRYRDTTIRRRIQRRMLVNSQHALTDYIKQLEKDAAEVKALFEDVLINVTSFFREPEMFESLKTQVFPKLIKNSPSLIRVWIPACSTGQEAYSMAMALLEFLEHKSKPPVIQIFATDVNEAVSVEKARRGYYPNSIENEVSPERLRRFFTREEKGYRINKSIRELCIFAKQNLIADPPFSRMDLISCRNVLIYFTPELQRRVISMFHYGLNPDGYLVLGTSEGVGANSDLFELQDRKFKFFTRKKTALRPFTHLSVDDLRPTPTAMKHSKSFYSPSSMEFQKEADRILLGRFAPAAVLINSSLEVLQFRGRTSLYLEPATGEASFNLLKMARENLPLELGSALQEVRRTSTTVRRTARLLDHDKVRTITLEIMPVRLPGSADNCYLVLFEEAMPAPPALEKTSIRKKAPGKKIKVTTVKDDELIQLRADLFAAREYLQSIVEQHDAASEELKCANEEVLSSNEELQSTNEQLGTAKEELQSTNEELVTLNEELQNRNNELNQLNTDLREAHEKLLDYVNVMVETVRAPLLVLRPDLRVHKANDAFYEAFQPPRNQTENQSIFDLNQGQWDFPELRRMLSEILTSKSVLKDLEVTFNFPKIGSRSMLLNARRLELKAEAQMILLSIEDITELKQAKEANQWLAAIVEFSSDAIIGEDLEGKIISCNQGAARFYGYTPDELIGKSISVLLPDQKQDEEQKILARIRRGEHVEHYEAIGRRKSGSLVDVSLTVSPVKDSQGKIIGASKIARDITGAKKAEAAVQESENRFRNVADSAPVMIWVSDTDKRCTWFNKPWLQFVGRSMKEELGHGWAENVHPEDLPRSLEIYNQAFAAREEFKIEYRLRRHDGEYRWVLDNGVPRYSGKEFSGYIGSCLDVTDRKIAEQNLTESFAREKEARLTAEAANRAKDDFLATLSHELRTPLNPVLLIASDAIKNIELPPGVRTDFNTIRKNIELEAKLIEDLLDLTRISSGKLTLTFNQASVHMLLNDAIQSVQADMNQKDIVLVLNLQAEHDLVRCDAVRLQQVFWNVLKNAVKFTPHQGKITVESNVSAEGDKLLITIKDTGIGMTPAELERIFVYFSQGTESSRFGGLGLGLAISLKLLESHAGRISAYSEGRNCGATFVIELPLLRAEEERSTPPLAAPAAAVPVKRAPGARILLVEDHEPTRNALTHLLISRRYKVSAAFSVAEALKIAADQKIDFVISDIGLPDGSGNTLMAQLRDDYGLKGIALTGYGMDQDIHRSLEAGFVAHLTKPVSIQALEKVLATADLTPVGGEK